ncbi:hypothetical protein JN531_003090 [Flagellatimonas centrodinii]|uniref:hypothetical protein n=1 Tax=Flagellatimonas centrodinii TaxID=2806210 RepID=UPI001FED7192|nr:hypothetical protein [Flagellatimonas centrodinii]ULQ47278.1 hypothetical protein JN531_003090 [Flagellatimonas centrodinii]
MSSPSPMNLARRRRALEIGLSGVLGGGQLRDALALWDGTYAKDRANAMTDFAQTLTAQLGLAPRQAVALRSALFQALLKYDVQRDAPPAGPASTGATIGSPAYIVFREMAVRLFNTAEHAGPEALRDFIETAESPETAILSGGLHQGDFGAVSGADDKTLASILHRLYVGLVHAVGPVAADRGLARAVSAAEALPAAVQFSPQRLL